MTISVLAIVEFRHPHPSTRASAYVILRARSDRHFVEGWGWSNLLHRSSLQQGGGDMPLLPLNGVVRPHLANGTPYRLATPPPYRQILRVEVSILILSSILLH